MRSPALPGRWWVFALLTFACLNAQLCYADITIHWKDGELEAARSIFGDISGNASSHLVSYVLSRMSASVNGDELSFAPIRANLMPYNSTNVSKLQGSIIVGYIPLLAPYKTHEAWIKDMISKYSPKALVLVTMRSLQQVEASNHASDMSMVNVPVISVCVNATSEASSIRLLQVLNRFPGGVDATLDSASPNNWFRLRRSWWSIFSSCALLAWAAGNVITAGAAMALSDGAKNMAFVILILELVANAVRLCWALDPFSARFIPPQLVEVFFSSSLPASLGSIVLLAFFWQELLQYSISTVSGVLTKLKIPAIIIMVLITLMEALSACFRASGVDVWSSSVLVAGFISFFLVLLGSSGYFITISIRLLRHLSQKKSYRKKDKIMRKFALRALGAAAGMIGMMLSIVAFFALLLMRSDSAYYAYFFIHAFANVVGTTQIVSLFAASRKSYVERSKRNSATARSSNSDAAGTRSSTESATAH